MHYSEHILTIYMYRKKDGVVLQKFVYCLPDHVYSTVQYIRSKAIDLRGSFLAMRIFVLIATTLIECFSISQ